MHARTDAISSMPAGTLRCAGAAPLLLAWLLVAGAPLQAEGHGQLKLLNAPPGRQGWRCWDTEGTHQVWQNCADVVLKTDDIDAVEATAAAAAADQRCDFAVVGAGAGGVYAAWRLATSAEQPVEPSQICVFERLPHVGGRTYTLHNQGPRHDLQVDLGATVFCDCLPTSATCGECNGMMTPLMKGVIQNALKLPNGPYRNHPAPSDTDYKGCNKLTKTTGSRENAGFDSYIEGMANQSAALGVRFFFGYDLQSLIAPAPATPSSGALPADSIATSAAAAAESTTALAFLNGETVAAGSVMLNMPVYPLNKLMRASPSLQPHLDASAFGGAWLRVPHGFRLFKLLLHYDWAWWRSLGLLDGPFSANRCGKDDAFCPLCTCDQSLPLAGRCKT